MALRDLAQARYVYLISKLKLSSIVGDDALTFVDEINAFFPSKISESGARP
jgi:outer membrane protein/protease secretion system outer membrane protein